MHDDRHGTAIISSAALLNALELADKKKAEDVKYGRSDLGSAAGLCRFICFIRMKIENIFSCLCKVIDKDNLKLSNYS
jgi:malate dehydrogenase (oxaloacetate-decarboxylating)(NADP+)